MAGFSTFKRQNATGLRQDSRRRGVVLVMVMGMVLLMGWVTVEILAGVRRELARQSSPDQHEELRLVAYQLLEVSIGVLAEINQFERGLFSPAQGWGMPLTYAGVRDTARPRIATDLGSGEQVIFGPAPAVQVTDDDFAESLLAELMAEIEETGSESDPFFARPIVQLEPGMGILGIPDIVPIAFPPGYEMRVRITDESGKLSLTATTEARWEYFFEVMGFEQNERSILIDSLLDWMDPDDEHRPHGAETEYYQQREPPYRAANRPLRDFEELRLIQGFETLFFEEDGTPNEYFKQFVDSVSLYHTGPVNLNTANRLVLETLAEEQDFEADDVINFLAGVDTVFGTADDRILRPGLNPDDLPKNADGDPVALPQTIPMVRVSIVVSSGRSAFTLDAFLDLTQRHSGGRYPFRITRIFENTRPR